MPFLSIGSRGGSSSQRLFIDPPGLLLLPNLHYLILFLQLTLCPGHSPIRRQWLR
jgi:hypothetical protein